MAAQGKGFGRILGKPYCRQMFCSPERRGNLAISGQRNLVAIEGPIVTAWAEFPPQAPFVLTALPQVIRPVPILL